MQFGGSSGGTRAEEKPIPGTPLQENDKLAHHPSLYQGSVCIIKAVNIYCCALRMYYNNGFSPHRLKYMWTALAIKATVIWQIQEWFLGASATTPGCHWHPREYLLVCVVSSPLLQILFLLLHSFTDTPFSSSSSLGLSLSAASSDSSFRLYLWSLPISTTTHGAQ